MIAFNRYLIAIYSLLFSIVTVPLPPSPIRVPQDAESIQAAIDGSSVGDVIIVSPGEYVEHLVFPGHDLILRSEEPTSSTVVNSTIIRAVDGSTSPVIMLTGAESPEAEIAGLTITGARYEVNGANGGGIQGNHSRITIRDNAILDNRASNGGGLANCHGLIMQNRIQGNRAMYGGGIYECNGVILDNDIIGNQGYFGGGLADCDAQIVGNTIGQNRNRAYQDPPRDPPEGGGLYRCRGILERNLIVDNTCVEFILPDCGLFPNPSCYRYFVYGKGGGLSDFRGQILNNDFLYNRVGRYGGGAAWIRDSVVVGNRFSFNLAHDSGGGIYGVSDSVFSSNIISSNHANYDADVRRGYYGGIYGLWRTIFANNLLINNIADMGFSAGGNIGDSIVINNISYQNKKFSSYSGIPGELFVPENNNSIWMNNIIEGWEGDPAVALDIDPDFISIEEEDYRLSPSSPLVDSGAYHENLPDTDFRGLGRFVKTYGTSLFHVSGNGIDIGPYEYQEPASYRDNVIYRILGQWSGESHLYDKNFDRSLDSADILNRSAGHY